MVRAHSLIDIIKPIRWNIKLVQNKRQIECKISEIIICMNNSNSNQYIELYTTSTLRQFWIIGRSGVDIAHHNSQS